MKDQKTFFGAVAVGVIVLLAGSESQTLSARDDLQTTGSQPIHAASKVLDACKLIDESEIASVQGGKLQSAVPSTETRGNLASSQCYFTISSADGTKNLSVHLRVSKADPNGFNPGAVHDYWNKFFGRDKAKSKGEEEKDEREFVTGVGDEAFWVGDGRLGVLYALKKDKLIRISVGGPDDPKTRLKKSKELATKVLKRLT